MDAVFITELCHLGVIAWEWDFLTISVSCRNVYILSIVHTSMRPFHRMHTLGWKSKTLSSLEGEKCTHVGCGWNLVHSNTLDLLFLLTLKPYVKALLVPSGYSVWRTIERAHWGQTFFEWLVPCLNGFQGPFLVSWLQKQKY